MCDKKGVTDTDVFVTATKLVAVALATGVIDYFEECVYDRKKKYRKSIALLLTFWLTYVKSYLTLNSNPTTWLEAQTHCNEIGGTLVTEVKANEDYLKEIIQKNGSDDTEYWQGRFMTPWVWLKGCFQLDSFDGFNTNFTLKFNQMSECVKYCNKTNYFGLHNKTCFCFDTLVGNSVQTDENCTIPCPGNNDERCGGNISLTVYMNDICYTRSSDWNGTISRTVTGKECLPWKNITSIGAESNLKFPDESLDNASNYCRDPNSTAALWCYISHNQTERCDVPPCDIPDAQKQVSGDRNCMATSRDSNQLSFEAKGCKNTHLNAVCLGVDNNVYAINDKKSWQTQRRYARKNQCKSLAGSSIFNYKEVIAENSGHHWIGFVRNHTTARTTDVAGKLGKCFTVSFQDSDKQLTEKEFPCSSNMSFLCEIVPVNCSEEFGDFTNGNFSTPHYPQPYDPRMHCIWTIFIPDDQLMTLQISMDIEDSPFCQYDFVKIYHGASTNDTHNVTLCGKQERVFHNVNTNITIQFLSDETVQSSGIHVSWTFVPNITTTTATTIITTTLASFTESQQGDMDDIKIELSVGSLAGVIVGIVFLVVLACIAGFLCGNRRRASPSNNKEEVMENGTDRINNEAVILPALNNENVESEYAFTNAVFEASATNALSPKRVDVERTNASPDKRVSDDPSTASDTSALYSQVNKPKKQDGVTKPKKPSVTADKGSKQAETPEALYNSLGENDENMYANKTENIYNHFGDSEQNYDTTTSPRDIPKKVAPDLETYDSKK